MEKLLSVKEVANLLGLAVPTIYKRVSFRMIPFIKLGSRVLFDPEQVQLYLKRNQVAELRKSKADFVHSGKK